MNLTQVKYQILNTKEVVLSKNKIKTNPYQIYFLINKIIIMEIIQVQLILLIKRIIIMLNQINNKSAMINIFKRL